METCTTSLRKTKQPSMSSEVNCDITIDSHECLVAGQLCEECDQFIDPMDPKDPSDPNKTMDKKISSLSCKIWEECINGSTPFKDEESTSEMVNPKSITNIEGIKSDLDTFGYSLVKNAVSPEEVIQFRQDVLDYLNILPRVEGKEIKLDSLSESLSKKEVKRLNEIWPLHKSFGAPTELDIFHLSASWHLREKPELYNLYSYLLGTNDLLANIDRVSIKLPGSGETEFIHIDCDPTYRKDNASLQSMIFFNDSNFYALPKSHTEAFHQNIVKTYGIKQLKKPRPMTMIDQKRDPELLDLEAQLQKIKVSTGTLLIWSENLWHASKPNSSDKIRLALYFGYHRPGESPNSIEERLESYETGRRPPKFPSGSKTSLVPARYYNYPYSKPGKPSLMQRYLDIVPEKYHGRHTVKSNGQVVNWLDEEKYNPIQVKDYQPPPLTKLGEKVLGKYEHDR